MCNRECCALKTALQIRMMKREIERRLREEQAKPIPKIIASPQTLLYPYDYVRQVADFIISKTSARPQFGLVCGVHLSDVAAVIDNPIVLTYADIPNFPLNTSLGHMGKLYVGTVSGATIIAMQGRFHSYEGNALASCVMPMRVMKLCGVEYMFLTGTANSINLKYDVGDIMLVTDHINMMSWMGYSPLSGPVESQFGKPNVDLKDAYDTQLIEKAIELGKDIGYHEHIHKGVYACVGGPVYETVAEQKFLRQIGIDVVGNSMTHEVTTARQCGMRVLAITFVNMPAMERTNVDDENFEEGQRVCAELISRMVYTIKNGLLQKSTSTVEKELGQYVAAWK